MGKIEVREYLTDFDRRNLPTDDTGYWKEDGKRIIEKGEVLGRKNRNKVYNYLVDKRHVFAKSYGDKDWTNRAVLEALMGHVYNDLGVNSSEGYPLRRANGDLAIATQNVSHLGRWVIDKDTQVKSVEEVLGTIFRQTDAYKVLRQENLKSLNTQNYDYRKTEMWGVILEPSVRQELLKHMTVQCYEEIKNMYLLDVIMGNPDRHYLNYFLTKKKGDKKWQSAIAFDNESSIYRNCVRDFRCGNAKDIFAISENIVTNFYTPQLVTDAKTHAERIQDVCDLIAQGKFTKYQYKLLTDILGYDLPAKISQMYKKYGIKNPDAQKLRDVMSYAWDEHQRAIDMARD